MNVRERWSKGIADDFNCFDRWNLSEESSFILVNRWSIFSLCENQSDEFIEKYFFKIWFQWW